MFGAGAGSEILGALSNGNSVIAFESDPTQYAGCKARLTLSSADHDRLVAEHNITPENLPKRLLVPTYNHFYTPVDIGHCSPFAQLPAFPVNSLAGYNKLLINRFRLGLESCDPLRKPCKLCQKDVPKSPTVWQCRWCMSWICASIAAAGSDEPLEFCCDSCMRSGVKKLAGSEESQEEPLPSVL